MFYWENEVRHYEVDQQNIVNNAIYLNYLEQARAKFVESSPLDLDAFEKLGYHFVVAKISIEYKRSLFAQDRMRVSVEIAEITDKRLIFRQTIIKEPTNKIAAEAYIEIACMNIETRRAEMPEKLMNDLSPIIKQ
jgi:acyl-CoA thioester hydrolase